ncbi:molybdate transport system regulatory protein [Lutibacter oricola]|uniref:Molybdate transport system regulatory protein n=1 Tax=Lutibacter oricola TaxID=762486 RepID=A0A1H3BJR4_9FLAO|nr:TOBE domain-containing protein [Lutibacter oricola]SDX41574.1 molybdate transport system regulatory protein [Lutibacter oricola]
MNTLKGTINSLTISGNLTLIGIKVGHINMSAIVIDTPKTAPYLTVENSISVIFKETEVILAKGNTDLISMRNKIKGVIEKIISEELLSKIIIKSSVGNITSIITTNAVKQLELKIGDEVTAMIKTNEIMLSE